MRTKLLCLAFLLTTFAPVVAQPVKRSITIDDYFTQADLFGVAYSPKWTAYVEGRWQESTDDRKTELWIVPSTGGTSRRLTSDRASSRSPQWHGSNLYFLANRKREGEK